MTRILTRAVRAVIGWLTEPVRMDQGAQSFPLSFEAWLVRSEFRSAFDRHYPPLRRTIPLKTAWMVRPC